jgi:hypothetical protein
MTDLSIHFQKIPKDVWGVLQDSPTTWVYIVDPPEGNPFPGKKVVARLFDLNEDQYVRAGAAGAQAWWRTHGGYVQARPWVHAWVVCNEPVGNDAAHHITIDEYMFEWTIQAHARGVKVVTGNFPTGNPEPEEMRYYAKSFDAADYWGFHEYWLPEHWLPQHAWARRDLMWRHKVLIDALPDSVRQKPVLITECGCDGLIAETLGKRPEIAGWHQYYKGNRERYLAHLEEYVEGCESYVQAVFVFTAGPWHDWVKYDVDAELAKRMVTMNGQTESVEKRPTEYVNEPTIKVLTPEGVVVEMGIEEYVRGVVPNEVFPSWPMATLEAQAIAARTYALAQRGRHADEGYDVCSTQHCQVYNEAKRTKRTDQAVFNTTAVVGTFEGRVVPTFFSGSCGGETVNVDWSGNRVPYLKARKSCPCRSHGHEVHGHQRGMCQWGAYYLVEEGLVEDCFDILTYYFDLEYRTEWGKSPLGSDKDEDKILEELEQRLATVEGRTEDLVEWREEVTTKFRELGQ